jgi:hypothetical protein
MMKTIGNQIAELFQRDKSVISKHIRNVYKEGELFPDSTVAFFATVQKEGSREISSEDDHHRSQCRREEIMAKIHVLHNPGFNPIEFDGIKP